MVGVKRAREAHRLAVQQQLAAIGLMHARQEVDHGGFARAILAQKRPHLARRKRQRNALQHGDAEKALHQLAGLKNGGGGRREAGVAVAPRPRLAAPLGEDRAAHSPISPTRSA